MNKFDILLSEIKECIICTQNQEARDVLNYLEHFANGLNNDEMYKQEMITIGDVSFPKPVSEVVQGAIYYIPNVYNTHFHESYTWREHEIDYRWLNRGMVHLSKENAIAHAKALVSLSGGTFD